MQTTQEKERERIVFFISQWKCIIIVNYRPSTSNVTEAYNHLYNKCVCKCKNWTGSVTTPDFNKSVADTYEEAHLTWLTDHFSNHWDWHVKTCSGYNVSKSNKPQTCILLDGQVRAAKHLIVQFCYFFRIMADTNRSPSRGPNTCYCFSCTLWTKLMDEKT